MTLSRADLFSWWKRWPLAWRFCLDGHFGEVVPLRSLPISGAWVHFFRVCDGCGRIAEVNE